MRTKICENDPETMCLRKTKICAQRLYDFVIVASENIALLTKIISEIYPVGTPEVVSVTVI